MPRRIQRTRAKGWKMPPETVYVGRSGIFGNPFVVDEYTPVGWPEPFGGIHVRDRAHAVELLRQLIDRQEAEENFALLDGRGFPPVAVIRKQLRGMDLACWCRLDEPCHADLLLEIANPAGPDCTDDREVRIYAGTTDDLGAFRGDESEEQEGDRDL